jgi:hypothetical protein
LNPSAGDGQVVGEGGPTGDQRQVTVLATQAGVLGAGDGINAEEGDVGYREVGVLEREVALAKLRANGRVDDPKASGMNIGDPLVRCVGRPG